MNIKTCWPSGGTINTKRQKFNKNDHRELFRIIFTTTARTFNKGMETILKTLS
jgi:hypothetical protein